MQFNTIKEKEDFLKKTIKEIKILQQTIRTVLNNPTNEEGNAYGMKHAVYKNNNPTINKIANAISLEMDKQMECE